MKYHVDDTQIIKRKQGFPDQIKLNHNHYLNYNKKSPLFTLLIYESTFEKDFKGGTLEFADNTIIYPKRGMYILFDSREVHRVHKITKGNRYNLLIKFYEKNSSGV